MGSEHQGEEFKGVGEAMRYDPIPEGMEILPNTFEAGSRWLFDTPLRVIGAREMWGWMDIHGHICRNPNYIEPALLSKPA